MSLTLLFICASSSSMADGYRNAPEGAAAIGAFGGHRAFADDANANIHNSANMVNLKSPMIQLNALGGFARTKFSNEYTRDKTDNPWFVIPGFSVAIPIVSNKVAVGFSTYIPFGRSVEWQDDDFFAATGYPYKGHMTVMDFTPNIAVRLTDSFSIGLGLDIYSGEVEQKQYIYTPAYYDHPLAGPIYLGTVTSHSKITADGSALGWNASASWQMTDRQRLALTYRAPFTIKYKGKHHLKTEATSFSPAMDTQSDISAEIDYPTIVALAYGVEFTDTLRAEFNVEWLEFSLYDSLSIEDSALSAPITSRQNLDNTWTYGIGGEWDFATNWTGRAGFMYLNNPTPDETYGTLAPDEDQGVISLGLGYETEHHAIDLGYAYGLFGGRKIRNSANSPDGDYDYNVHLLALSYGYKF